MGIQHLLLILIYLDPLNVLLCAGTRTRNKNGSPRRKGKEVNSTVIAPVDPPSKVKPIKADHDTCLGYYDVSGQFDKEFECNNTSHRYCCGSCYLRFCCDEKVKRIDQKSCRNYVSPDWIQTPVPGPPEPTVSTYDPNLDQTNTTVYITCGVIIFVIVAGVAAKVAYDKATRPPQEMNVHRALADILRQQGASPIPYYEREKITAIDGSPKENTPVRTSKNHYTPVRTMKSNHALADILRQQGASPIPHYEREKITAIDGSPKENTPVRTSKNHYTPVRTMKSNHGGHYGKDNFRSGGPDLHNFISSGFVTLGRGHQKVHIACTPAPATTRILMAESNGTTDSNKVHIACTPAPATTRILMAESNGTTDSNKASQENKSAMD
ncbi:UNVERIFIED_CONTAM: hypothetical protein FKN15_057136 [Acipenser sinensis]